MDKNPNALDGKHRRLVLFGHSSGISRKEFVRVAYGAFKTAGKEDALVAALTKQIEAGQNRARRVLARRGQPDYVIIPANALGRVVI